MNLNFIRISRFFLFLVAISSIFLAIIITILRITLFRIEFFQEDFETWLSQASCVNFQVSEMNGFFRNGHIYISLEGLHPKSSESCNVFFSAKKLEIKLDLIQSIIQLQPVISNLTINEFQLDFKSINPFHFIKEIGLHFSSEKENLDFLRTIIANFDSLLLRQLNNFSFLNSSIHYNSRNGQSNHINIEKFRWQSNKKDHRVEGLISIDDSTSNSLFIRGHFIDNNSFNDLSGELYISADNIAVTPWLNSYFTSEIDKGEVSFNSWLSISHNQTIDVYVKLKPSKLIWKDQSKHSLLLESGRFRLSSFQNNWITNIHLVNVQINDITWPKLDMVLNWQPEKWFFNIVQIDMETFFSVMKLAPNFYKNIQFFNQIRLKGLLKDVRVSMEKTWDSLHYSAGFSNVSMEQWNFFPEIHHVSGSVFGNIQQAKISITLIDEILPYDKLLQAALNIQESKIDLIWQNNANSWSLWSDNIIVITPDLQVLGTFHLDFPENQSPFLSFYAEANLYNASQTWRYLPKALLGENLTNYLSSSIQAGEANAAKLLWYGKLAGFPYSKNNGIFQAWIGLKKAQFAFDTDWPPLTNMQVNLLFENDSMYFESYEANSLDVKVNRITGHIPFLGVTSYIEMKVSVVAEGDAFRDYILVSPLIDSVGTLLSAIHLTGEVHCNVQINIPLNMDSELKTIGYVDLNNNNVKIDSLSLALESVYGQIEFNNGLVKAKGITTKLFSQPVELDLVVKNIDSGYELEIDLLGNNDIKFLSPYVGKHWTRFLSGYTQWKMDVNVQLNEFGFMYKIDGFADLKMIKSEYPYPFHKDFKQEGKFYLQIIGDHKSFNAEFGLPKVRYQAEVDIISEKLLFRKSNFVISSDACEVIDIPIVDGHYAQIQTNQFNLDEWIAFYYAYFNQEPFFKKPNKLIIPIPEKIRINASELTLANIQWNDVNFFIHRKNLDWYFDFISQEFQGKANYIELSKLSISLERLYLYSPKFSKTIKNNLWSIEKKPDSYSTKSFNRIFHKVMPNLTLTITDFWLQGYKVGKVNINIKRDREKLKFKKISFISDGNEIHINGAWTLDNTRSHVDLSLVMTSKNNSELMERFGITSRIQEAPLQLSSLLRWDGSPWSVKLDSLEGKVNSALGKGILLKVSNSSRVRLLGVFNLDSIIRKIKLDFSDFFSKGISFNSIKGTGEIKKGIFVTNDTIINGISGKITINGSADLIRQVLDAEINFVPDIISGVPFLSALIMSYHTTIYVFAITAAITPVLDALTQVNYSIKGPLGDLEVKKLTHTKIKSKYNY
ncbi:YhdP family protein [Candidatus Photodesmus anomalopis]|uniref:YhdP central domain-containing protein n=1 Tax=Candidatus Photodesmus katoptron Akat1 TaxID=1236703 RepID=S3DGZ4_9GAMM|nr:YhdP family protein [Candidatus Photodesmus katoptron]EPE37732.1 hypothetical protein O1U_0191 [Candidatus Photodesmus katoptron Akat1]